MEGIKIIDRAQVRIVARAGRRTAERARRKRIHKWKSPSLGPEKKLFDDDLENQPPLNQNQPSESKVLYSGISVVSVSELFSKFIGKYTR
mmetsp:Transcript_44415/g.56867  ORF Transcript_44415/g.56867 Transcript_44415/m.56867 type:complete len:90 (+) Transcript_44415:693-962(+)